MRELRRILWFFVGVLIAFVSLIPFARAATVVYGAGESASYVWIVAGSAGTGGYVSKDPFTAANYSCQHDELTFNAGSVELGVPTAAHPTDTAYKKFFQCYKVAVNGQNSCSGAQVGQRIIGTCGTPAQHTVETDPWWFNSTRNVVLWRACKYATNPDSYSLVDATTAACPTGPEDPCKAQQGKAASGPGFFSCGTNASCKPNPPAVGCTGSCTTVFYSGSCPDATRLVSGVPNYYCSGKYLFEGGGCTAGDTPGPVSPPDDSCAGGKVVSPGPPKTCVDPPPDPCPAGQERVAGVCTPIPCPSGYHRDGANCVPDAPPPPPGPGDPPNPPPPPPPDPTPPGGGSDPTFCEKNPTDPACVPSAFSGKCGLAPTCSGDPIQCAVATATTQLACDFEPNPKAMSELRDTIGKAYQPSNYAVSNTWSYDMSNVLDLSDKDSGASCPTDIEFSAMGGSFTIPMSPFCTLAGYARFFLTFAAMVIAMRIMFTG